MEESQNKNWDGCPLFFIRGKDQDIERLKRGGCYEREKQRGKGKQEGATEKPEREEKDEEGEEEQVGWTGIGIVGVGPSQLLNQINHF